MASLTQTIAHLLIHHARTRPEQVAFSTPHQSTTFAALATSTHRLAAHLAHQAGPAHVAIVLPRCIEFVETVLAVTRASGVGVPLDPRSTAVELRWTLRDCGARVVVTDGRRLGRVCAALGGEAAGILIVVVNASQSDVIANNQADKVQMVRYEEWAHQGPSSMDLDPLSGALDSLGLDEPAWLHYTSGTTGTPKGVLSSQRAWLVSAAHYAEAVGITASDKLFWPLPLYHAFGHSLCIIGTLVIGASVYLTGQDDGVLSSLLCSEGLSIIAGVPSTYHELVTETAQSTEKDIEKRLPRPRVCISAGGTTLPGGKGSIMDTPGWSPLNNCGSSEAHGPIATATTARLSTCIEQMLGVPLLNRYGCTESCGAIAANAPNDVHCENLCGAALPHMEVQIADTNTDVCKFVADDEEGEIWVRGPSTMLRYWSSQPQRQPPASFTDEGWYRTGDVGCRLSDSGGQLSVHGRLNELIRRGSETIHPAEVERVLGSCPGVGEVVVTGVPHSMLGETAAAFIVRAAPDAVIDLVAILAACRAVLPDYKVPAMFFEIQALPRTKSGKLRRRAALDCHRRPLTARNRLGKDTIGALVRAEVRAACGLGPEEHLDYSLPFADLGMNSLAGVVLRDRLASLTGLEDLPTTLVFDQPTPSAVIEHLRNRLLGRTPESGLDTQAGLQDAATKGSSADKSHDPIAIISMACRYPGTVSSPSDLWDVVTSGTDATSSFPTDRGWDLDTLFSSDPGDMKPGRSTAKRGGFLTDMALFDTAPFHISPREALATDPQQRLLLETTWHLAERARIAPSALRGSNTGVFVGVMHSDYGSRFVNSDPHDLDSHLGLGSAGSVAAGRIAYTFDLYGPSMAIDTACSSSIVAIDLAANSLRSGECALAIAGGVTVMATPRPFVMFSRQGGLAADGRCKSYSAAADGTAWSEGVGLLLLERLSDAQRNRHEVLGLVRGSAVNSDGASNGLTAPSGAAQERVIRQALKNAGLGPEEVDVLEGHGTATPLGDAIEAQAIVAAYGSVERDFPLLLGSIKSNIGHSQAAAGVAGVIKLVQAMKHGMVPKSLHVDKPLSHIAKEDRVVLVTEARPWPRRKKGGPRRAAVSSFGIGGTNSHIILEEYVADTTEGAPTTHLRTGGFTAQGAYPWLLSGTDEASVRAQAEALLGHNLQHQQSDAIDIAFSLATTRSSLPHRAAIVPLGSDIEDYTQALTAFARSREHAGAVTGTVPGSAPRLVFMFSGQGSLKRHSIKDIKELCLQFPAFDTAFRTICTKLDPLLALPLSQVIRDEHEDLIKHTDLAQSAIFALEVAMFRLLESFGVHPDAVVGHSVGEISAAHVAGYLSLAGAAVLITTRGRLMAALPDGQGAMASISASEEDVDKALAKFTGGEGACTIAAVNDRKSVVISGSVHAVNLIMDVFAAQGHSVSLLKGVDHAFHSPLMDSMLKEFGDALCREPAFYNSATEAKKIPLVSTVTGKLADASQLASSSYWTCQARAAVRFADAVDTLAGMGDSAFVEIGPSAPLSTYVRDAIATRGSLSTLHEALGRLWVCGILNNWEAVFDGTGARAVNLPVYRFQRRRYWLDPPRRSLDVSVAHRGHIHGTIVDHPILANATPVPGSPGTIICHGCLSLDIMPWLADHRVDGRPVVPATVLADLALSAGHASVMATPVLKELAIIKPLSLGQSEGVVIQVVIKEEESLSGNRADVARSVDVYSRPLNADVNQEWTQHGTGALKSSSVIPPLEMPDSSERWQAINMDIDGAYAALTRAGIAYGTLFRGVQAVWQSEDGLFLRVQIRLPDQPSRSKPSSSFVIHPILLDAALHAGVLVGMSAETSAENVELYLPFLLKGVHILGSVRDDEPVFVKTPSRKCYLGEGDTRAFSVTVEDHAGKVVAVVAKVATRLWKPTPVRADPFRLEWTRLNTEKSSSNSMMSESQNGTDSIVEVREFVSRHLQRVPLPDAVHIATAHVLHTIQRWAMDESFSSGGRMVIVTENASTPNPDLTSAAVWGLVRSVQAEFGLDRLVLVDLDGDSDSTTTIARVLASGKGIVAVQNGRLMIPKLSRVQTMLSPTTIITPSSMLNTSGTVMITGGTGALGVILARHLVRVYNAKSLLLLSRLGPAASCAGSLIADLSSAGATTRILACGVDDRDQLAAIFTAAHPPITAIVHTAGVLDDGILSTQTAQRVSSVLRPKVDGAWLLHELAPPEAQLFLFSSAAGVLGNRGQAGYAAGNCFLDGLARYRRAQGLHALSLAWGPWANERGMASGNTRRGMLVPLSDEQGLDAFDAALRMNGEEAVVIPLLLRGGSVESLPLSREHETASLTKAPHETRRQLSWRGQLAAIQSREHRTATLRGLVQTEVAEVLGYQPGDTLPDRPFADLGIDSFTAVQLRNRIGVLSGLKGLPATLAFDTHTVTALVENLLDRYEEATGNREMGRTPLGHTSINIAEETGLRSSETGRDPKPPAPSHALPRGNALQGLARLCRSMCEAGKYDAAIHTLAAASLTLPRFSPSSPLNIRPTPRHLATGSRAEPALIVIPDFTPMTSKGESRYSSLAASMGNDYDIYELSNPDMMVPDSLDTLAEMHADTVREAFDGRAIILVGYSAGGCVAHAVAHRLLSQVEDSGRVAGLVLIDTYTVSKEENPEWLVGLALPAAASQAFEGCESEAEETLAGAGAYFRIAAGWRAGPLPRRLRTLFVRAREAMPGADRGWRPTEWFLADRTVEVSGNHLSILDDRHVRAVVKVICEWVNETKGGP